MLGLLSFFSAIYSLSQWTTRGRYVLVKRRTSSSITKQSRQILLFLRKHHQLFGWIVLATATAHAIVFVPLILSTPFYQTLTSFALVTGTIAWILLIILSALGLWIDYIARRRKQAPQIRLVHITTALIFLVVFILHVQSS